MCQDPSWNKWVVRPPSGLSLDLVAQQPDARVPGRPRNFHRVMFRRLAATAHVRDCAAAIWSSADRQTADFSVPT